MRLSPQALPPTRTSLRLESAAGQANGGSIDGPAGGGTAAIPADDLRKRRGSRARRPCGEAPPSPVPSSAASTLQADCKRCKHTASTVQALLAVWDDYAKANNVILPSRGPFETLEDQLPQRVPVEAGFPPLIYKRQFVPPKDMLADPKP